MAFVAIGYGRASTDKQTLSTEQQKAVCLDVFALKQRINQEWADAVWGGFFADEATCRETLLRERHAGSMALALLKPGDRIMCAAHDRMFCDMIDFCSTMNLASEMKFRVVVGDKEIDPADEDVMFYNTILTALSERELQKIRRRTRDALAHRRKIGRPVGGSCIGWTSTIVRVPGLETPQKFYVPDNRARRLAVEILRIKNDRRLCYSQALQFCNSMGIKNYRGRRWNDPTFKKWCVAAESNFPLPNGSHEAVPIPAGAVPFVFNSIAVNG